MVAAAAPRHSSHHGAIRFHLKHERCCNTPTLNHVIDWFQTHAAVLQNAGAIWLAVGVGSLAVTLVTLPLVILRLPPDYFVRPRRVPLSHHAAHPVIAVLVLTLKNLIGLTLLILGAVMLFIPGQGILTMLIGLLLMNFPGKYHLEQKLVRRPAVLRTLNRIRARWDRPPLQQP